MSKAGENLRVKRRAIKSITMSVQRSLQTGRLMECAKSVQSLIGQVDGLDSCIEDAILDRLAKAKVKIDQLRVLARKSNVKVGHLKAQHESHPTADLVDRGVLIAQEMMEIVDKCNGWYCVGNGDGDIRRVTESQLSLLLDESRGKKMPTAPDTGSPVNTPSAYDAQGVG